MLRLLLLTAILFLLFQAGDAATRRYRVTWNDDPSSTMTIVFEQYDDNILNIFDNPGTARVYWDINKPPSNDPSHFANSSTHYRSENESWMNNYFVRLSGLQPATRYYFVVDDEQATSQVFYFETAPDDPSRPLSIIAGGDSRAAFGGGSRTARQNANLMVAKLRPDMVLFTGDFTNLDDPFEWQDWFDDWQLTIADDGRMTPILPVRGNHELDASRVNDHFDSPFQYGNKNNTYYALQFGGDLLRIYCLNSMVSITGDQATWLADDLQNSEASWKFAQYHYAIAPHTSSKPNRAFQLSEWVPLFEQYGVQLAIEGDSHIGKYTLPVVSSSSPSSDDGFEVASDSGVVYIGEGGWGAELRSVNDDKAYTVASHSDYQLKWIWVSLSRVQVRTILTASAPEVAAKADGDNKFRYPDGLQLWKPDVPTVNMGYYKYGKGIIQLTNPNTLSPGLSREQEFSLEAPEGEEPALRLEKIVPNPAESQCTLFFYSNEARNLHLSLFNTDGQILRSKDLEAVAGKNNYRMELGLPAGSYFIQLRDERNGHIANHPLMIQP